MPLVPIGWVVSDEFYTIKRVKGASMHPTLNPQFPQSSFLEDDYVLVKRVPDTTNWNHLKDKLVLVKDPFHPTHTQIRRLKALQGEWCPHKQGFIFVQSGHAWLDCDNPQEQVNDFEMNSVPLALIKGEVVGVVWPIERFNLNY